MVFLMLTVALCGSANHKAGEVVCMATNAHISPHDAIKFNLVARTHANVNGRIMNIHTIT